MAVQESRVQIIKKSIVNEDTILNKVNKLISETKKQKVMQNDEPHFMSFLNSRKSISESGSYFSMTLSGLI
jgi:hypothetical protein